MHMNIHSFTDLNNISTHISSQDASADVAPPAAHAAYKLLAARTALEDAERLSARAEKARGDTGWINTCKSI